jgi:hypothetical protein
MEYCIFDGRAHYADGDVGVWVWGGDGQDHPESLTCPVLMSAEQLRELLAKIPAEAGGPDAA